MSDVVRFELEPTRTHALLPIGPFRSDRTLCGVGNEAVMGRGSKSPTGLLTEVSCVDCCAIAAAIAEFSFAPAERQVEPTAVLF